MAVPRFCDWHWASQPFVAGLVGAAGLFDLVGTRIGALPQPEQRDTIQQAQAVDSQAEWRLDLVVLNLWGPEEKIAAAVR
jgi:hypothetical protein